MVHISSGKIWHNRLYLAKADLLQFHTTSMLKETFAKIDQHELGLGYR